MTNINKIKHFCFLRGLSVQEVNVVECLLLYGNREEICRLLQIRPKTIKFHMTNIYKKLKVHSLSEMYSVFFRALE